MGRLPSRDDTQAILDEARPERSRDARASDDASVTSHAWDDGDGARRFDPRALRERRSGRRAGGCWRESRDGWVRPRRVARRDDGCAESAPAARVTLDAAIPLGARDVECRFALVDETADAWASDETGFSRVVPLGNATRDDKFWHLAREALGGVDDHHPAHASPARVDDHDPTVVTCAFPPLGGPNPDALAGALDAGALTVTVAWRDPAPAHVPAPAPAADDEDEDPSPTPRRIARPALDDPASRLRFATRAWRLATVPPEIRAPSPFDLVELRGRGIAPGRRMSPRRARSKDSSGRPYARM